LISVNAAAVVDYHDFSVPTRSPSMRTIVQLFALVLMTSSTMAQTALDPSAQRGLTIARTYCARCHSIDRISPSPLKIAPPFRTLHKKYPVEQLEEPLAEGLSTGHPTMPEFRLEVDQINDFIAFLKSLE
jgi:cytochrome c553